MNIDPECDNCGRELDEDDVRAGCCVCGCAIPREVIDHFEKKAAKSAQE